MILLYECVTVCNGVFRRLCKTEFVHQIECFGGWMELWVESGGYGAFCLLSALNIHF